MARVKVLEVLEANVGGARKHVHQLLLGLDPERFERHLACSLERDPDGEEELEMLRAAGIRVTTIPMQRRPSPVADVQTLRQLAALMRAHDYDLVHTHAAKAGFLGRLAARRCAVGAVLHTPHTFPFERLDTPLRPLYRLLERLAASWADRVVLVAPSQRQAALAARLCDEGRLAVVENGIAPLGEEPEVLRRRYRDELGLADDTPAVAFVGRVTPQKDLQTFLPVAEDVLRVLPDARVFLVGGADNHRYLRSLRPRVGEQAWPVLTEGERPPAPVHWSPSLAVQVLGHRADASELVAAFDVVLLPSRYEGLPYSLLEAMACGVAVVASDVTGNRDVVRHGKSGLLAPPGDVRAFARWTLKLLTEPELRGQLGAAARERVAESFTEARFLRRMAELYESAIETAALRRKWGH